MNGVCLIEKSLIICKNNAVCRVGSFISMMFRSHSKEHFSFADYVVHHRHIERRAAGTWKDCLKIQTYGSKFMNHCGMESWIFNEFLQTPKQGNSNLWYDSCFFLIVPKFLYVPVDSFFRFWHIYNTIIYIRTRTQVLLVWKILFLKIKLDLCSRMGGSCVGRGFPHPTHTF